MSGRLLDKAFSRRSSPGRKNGPWAQKVTRIEEPWGQISCTAKQSLHPQPLLGAETTAVIALVLDLIAYAGGVIALFEIGRAKKHIPARQQYAKVVAPQCCRTFAFMPDANAVMQPVKARADPEPLAQSAKPDPYIGVLEAFAELGQGDDDDELPWWHANELRHHHDDAIDQNAVKQVIAVVAPHRHLPLRMVQ